MGRHRKYHTAEERKAANRKKAKAYYYRHHAEICSNRRKRGSETNASSSSCAPSGAQTLPTVTPNTGSEGDRFKEPSYWVQRALNQKDQVSKLIENRPLKVFLNDLCNDLSRPDATQRGATECVEDYLNGLAAIRKRVDTCHGHILNLVGVGPDLKTVSSVYRAVDAVVRPLEEIEVMIMTSLDHFRREFRQNGLTSFLN